MRTLKLTSPPMRGTDVKTLQTELRKDGYLKDVADGIYGDLTAQAVHRGKHWLGYRVPDKTASQLLLDYLTGKRKPSAEMKKRTAARKKAQARKPLREKALEYLSGHIGEKESPAGSNRIAFASEWYRLTGPWCAMAVTRAYVEAGSKSFKRSVRYAYCPYILGDAQRGRNGLALTKDPQPGDICLFDWEAAATGRVSVVDHVGLFVRWKNTGRTQFESVEGNTSAGSSGSQSNGGMVARRTRSRTGVVFVHCSR